jgi:hypothetical protein
MSKPTRFAKLERILDDFIAAEVREAKVQGAESILTALYESLQHGHSLGRVADRFAELAGLSPTGLRSRLQLAGGLTVNNALNEQYEAEQRGREEAGA